MLRACGLRFVRLLGERGHFDREFTRSTTLLSGEVRRAVMARRLLPSCAIYRCSFGLKFGLDFDKSFPFCFVPQGVSC